MQREQPITPKSYDFDYFLSRAPFRVPKYQRAFDWEENEVSEFARDVKGLVKLRLSGTHGKHFFGAVLSVFDSAGHYYEIVDGQQRLATEMLCLKELHDRWTVLSEQAKRVKKKSIYKVANQQAAKVAKRLGQGNHHVLTLSKRYSVFL